MPAGDQITGNYQAELNGLWMRKGGGMWYAKPGLKGAGLAPRRIQDLELAHDHGDILGATTRGSKDITWPLVLVATTADAVVDLFEALTTAWGTLGEAQFHFQLPGFGHRYFVGEPRGLDEDVLLVGQGVIRALCTFRATNPTMGTYTP